MRTRLLIILLLLAGCDNQPPSDADLNAVLWMQTSGEYYGGCEQAYRAAAAQLPAALADATWSADVVQAEQLAADPALAEKLKPAVVLDVDETVLDNSAYQARNVRDGTSFNLDSWQAWVREMKATAVPGVKSFVDAARAHDIEVFYVTNRDASVEAFTRENLQRLGLVQPDGPDVILSKNERLDWGSDKDTRRAHLARNYRILLLAGDDLNDFISTGRDVDDQQRHTLAVKHADLWGTRWIILPNPSYGGWERALYNFESGLSAAEIRQKKFAKLKSLETGGE